MAGRWIAALLPLLVLGTKEKVEENPIQKVVNMMQDMQKELEHEAEAEKEIFEKAACSCESGEKELKAVIEHSTEEIPRLTSKIEANEAEEKKLTMELEGHTADKADTEKTIEETTSMRAKDAEKFSETSKMQAFSLDSTNKAIQTLEAKGAAFFQGMHQYAKPFRRIVSVTPYLTDAKRNTILNFLDEASGYSNGEPSAGTAQIIGILKVMSEEMAKDLQEMRESEKAEIASFNDMKAAKMKHLGILVKTISDKEKRVGELKLALSQDSDSLEDTQEELDNAQKYLATMTEQCASMEKNRAMREKMRSEEILAISEAIKILTDDDAMETFKKTLPSASFVQQSTSWSVPASEAEPNLPAFLQIVSKKQSQPVLAQLRAAVHLRKPSVKEASGQAAKVVDYMITNMVEVLHNDDVNDEHKKEWCANETEVFHQLKTDKAALVEETEKTIEVKTSEMEQLKADIKQLEEEINSIDQETLDATALRKKQHAEFAASYAANDVAKQLIDKAANRLNEFYNPKMAKKGKSLLSVEEAASKIDNSAFMQRATTPVEDETDDNEPNLEAFIQVNSKNTDGVDPIDIPDTPRGAPAKSESGGVLGLMNELKSELTLDMKESEIEEKHAQKDYARVMKEAQATREANVKALTTKRSVKAETEQKLLDLKETLKLTKEEQHEINLYLARIHAECDFLLRNFENRHEARVEEQVGLHSAESIVTHEEVETHQQAEEVYESEDSKKDVQKHFPDEPMPTPEPVF